MTVNIKKIRSITAKLLDNEEVSDQELEEGSSKKLSSLPPLLYYSYYEIRRYLSEYDVRENDAEYSTFQCNNLIMIDEKLGKGEFESRKNWISRILFKWFGVDIYRK